MIKTFGGWLEIKRRYICRFPGITFYFRDPFTNYCGPGWSDGKWQESVEDGTAPTLNRRDKSCKRHDNAYFKAKGDNSLLAKADLEFYNDLVTDRDFELSPDYFLGVLFANAVYYGNKLSRNMSETYDPYDAKSNLRREQRGIAQLQWNSSPQIPLKADEQSVYAPVINANNNGFQPSVVQEVCEVSNDTPVMREERINRVPKLNITASAMNQYGGNDPYILFSRYFPRWKKPKKKKSSIGARRMHKIFVSS